MGASHSTPPPLVQVNAPGGKILVPSGTAFTVHPPYPAYPAYPRSLTSPHTPMYSPYASSRHGSGPQMRARHYARHGARWPDGDVIEGSEGDESTTVVDGMDAMDNIMGGRGMRGMRGYTGGGMGGGTARRIPSYFETLGNTRPRSAPAMPIMPGTGYVSGMHYMPGPTTPGMGDGGGGGSGGGGGLHKVQTGGGGGVGGMMGTGVPMMRGEGIADMQQQQAPPPEYTANPNLLPRYSGVAGGEMHGAHTQPYAGYPGPRPPSPASSTSTPAPQAPPQTSRRARPAHYEHVPMGAYVDVKTAQKSARRPRREPQTSTRLNRGQPLQKKVGASGEEWLQDDAFLDACTCTTNCNCRKSQRVLYRARNERRRRCDDSDDDDGEDHDYGSGEIRYILKDDLGRDCGDHSGCKKSSSGSDSDSSRKKETKKKTKKEKKQDRKRRNQFEGLKDDLLEALDERLQDMTKASRQRDQSGSPARPSLGVPGLGQQTSCNLMNGPGIDPRIYAQQLGAMAGNPYGMATTPGMGPMPPGMTGPSGNNGPMHQDMSMAMAGFQHDVSDMDGPRGMGMGIGNANMQYGMMNKKAMRPNLMSPRGAKAGVRFSGDGMGMDMDRMAAMYSQAMGSRGGIPGHGGSRRSRRAHLDSESDDLDSGPGLPMRSGIRHRAGRGSRGLGRTDKDSPNRRDFGASPLGRNNSSRDRGKQARVDTDDDDAY